VKTNALTDGELELAREEYTEEYPPLGEGRIKLKTYPFKRYLDSKK